MRFSFFPGRICIFVGLFKFSTEDLLHCAAELSIQLYFRIFTAECFTFSLFSVWCFSVSFSVQQDHQFSWRLKCKKIAAGVFMIFVFLFETFQMVSFSVFHILVLNRLFHISIFLYFHQWYQFLLHSALWMWIHFPILAKTALHCILYSYLLVLLFPK